MRHRRKKRSGSPKHIHAQKRKSNAYKVPSKRARRLTAATIALAVLGGAGTTFWVIHQVNQLQGGVASAVTQSLTNTSSQNAPGQVGSNQTQPSASTPTGGGRNTVQGTPAPKNKPAQKTTSSEHTPAKATNDTELPTKQSVLQIMMKEPVPESTLIHLPAMSQMPQLRNGCEITSLSMLLGYVGHPVNKMALAAEEPQDETPLVIDKKTKQILSWGNPNVGFVGSVVGIKKWGYGIYHGPLTQLVNEYLPNRGLDLTGMPFKALESIVAGGTPVEVWDTSTFKPTAHWVTWKSPEGPVHATFYEHAVLMVGYDQNSVFINNPLNGKAAQRVPKKAFIQAWEQLGKQAITVAPRAYQQQVQ